MHPQVTQGESEENRAAMPPSCPFSVFDRSLGIRSLKAVACSTASSEHFFVVRWGDSTAEDIERVIAEVKALHAEHDVPLYYLGILPEEMPKIDERQRDDFMRLSETLLPLCAVFAVAIEAKGFRGAIQRSAMAAITLLTRKYRGLRFVDSIETALEIDPDALPGRAGVNDAILKVGASPP
jgi:hypothetical protein